ncbi:MAG: hypothetical protein ACON4M_03500 [Crocinitomicaceae bacterium]
MLMLKYARLLSLFTILSILSYSCSDAIKTESEQTISGMTVEARDTEEEEHEAYVVKIDLDDSLKIIHSLFFTKEDGSQIDITGYLNQNDEVVKLIEKYVDGANKFYKQTTFYIKDGKKYVSNEHFDDTTNRHKPQFIERISYYDQETKPLFTKERKAIYEEDLGKSSFYYVEPYDYSIKRALDVINQEGKFQTKFQGLVFSGPHSYITVGEEDGYISALLIQYESDFTRKLKKNQLPYLGKPLELNFQRVVDDNGFQFQLLFVVNEKEVK